MLESQLIYPVHKFRAAFVNCKSFVGTCSTHDVCNFLYIHEKLYTFIFWINKETLDMSIAFMVPEADYRTVYRRYAKIGDVRFVVVALDIEDYNLAARNYSTISIVNTKQVISSVSFQTIEYSPQGSATINDVIKRFESHAKTLLCESLTKMTNMTFPHQSVQISFFQHVRSVVLCEHYVDHEGERESLTNEEMNVDKNRCFANTFYHFQPRSLRQMCVFFVSNYFQGFKRFELYKLPTALFKEVRDDYSFIGKATLLKNPRIGLKERDIP